MVRFRVAEEVFARFPDYQVVALAADGIDNRQHAETARQLLAESVHHVCDRFAGTDPKDIPAIAVWRQAFRQLGWSASTYQSSVEALLRRTLKGNPPPSISPAVDLANAASLRFLVPIGTHDLTSAPQGIAVRVSQPGDSFLPLGDGEAEAPDPGEIVYAHEHHVRTRRWVWRQSRIGLVTPDTRVVFYPIDAFRGVTDRAALEAADWLTAHLRTLLGAEHVTVALVDRQNPEVDLDPASDSSTSSASTYLP
ncbi:MAG: phenylalanine--tRNA ligase beta subunit-related protein [Thermomicrobium sp.]|nr:phenylalanine--tRNA ligase beta subunit-related protein [Thermomicrobium sp.]